MTEQELQAIKERQYNQTSPENPVTNSNFGEMAEFVFWALADRHALITEVERLHNTSIFSALAEIDRLRAVLEFYANESAAIKDGGHKARKALEGCKDEQG